MLNPAVQGDRHSGQLITWYLSGLSSLTVKDLTGATLSGTITDTTEASRAITGILTVTNGTGGQFTWAYSAADTATVGKFTVQFTALYPDGKPDSSFELDWEVKKKR